MLLIIISIFIVACVVVYFLLHHNSKTPAPQMSLVSARKKIAISYAHNGFVEGLKTNVSTAKSIGGFDVSIPYGLKDIDAEFVAQNQSIFKLARGAGYWIWKPYVILKTLLAANDGDYIFYCDAGGYYESSIEPVISYMENLGQEILPFYVEGNRLDRLEYQWTKRDTFIYMNCDTNSYTKTRQRNGAFQLVKRTPATIAFYRLYLDYAQNGQVLTDVANQYGKDNYEGFKEHRHDQSIWSLLTKREGLASGRDPSQWGNDEQKDGEYPQIVNLHRSKR